MRNDLNNKTGTLIRFHSDAQRWQLQVSGSQEMIRIREINVCRDRIEIIPMNEPVHQILRPAWKNPCDSIESANVAFVNYVTNQRRKTFRGQVFIHIVVDIFRTNMCRQRLFLLTHRICYGTRPR